jgi:hypothetical protein
MTELKTTDKTQLIEAYFKYASNQKKCEKYSLCYDLDTISPPWSNYCVWVNHYKRKEVMEKLRKEVNEDNILKLVTSEYKINLINQFL